MMIGGRVQQRVGNRVEVLCTKYMDRAWRLVEFDGIREGDTLWWGSGKGYLSRECKFYDKPIGVCKDAAAPDLSDFSRANNTGDL